MSLFKGVNLNDPGDPQPWGLKEQDALKDIINALAIDTVDGDLTNAKVQGHHHFNIYSKNNNVLSLTATTGANIEIFNNLRIISMTTEGFLKNDASGNISGGNIIDITDIEDQLPPHFLNGFVDRTQSTMSFNDGLRIFTIQPLPTESYVIWSNNTKFTKGDAENITIDDTEGPVLIYFDDDGNLATIFQGDPLIDNLFLRWAFIAVISWDVPNQVQIFFGEERHGLVMSPMTTFYLHSTAGARLAHEPGFALSGFVIDTGDADVDAQFAVAGGRYYNEDVILDYTDSVPQAISPLFNGPVYFLVGANADFRKDAATAFPVKPFIGGSGRLAFNEFTGGAWQQTEVVNNDFVLTHVFVTNETTEPLLVVQGQASYATETLAQDGAETELLSLSVVIPTNEIIPIATVIYQTNNGMTNAVKAKVVLTADGAEYIDWRFLRIGGAALGTQNDHNALFNLLVGDAHSQYMKIAGRSTGQTLIGGLDANDDLTLETTANATKGDYVFSEMTSAGLLKNTSGGVVTGGNQANLTTDVTGTLPVASGGTNGITAQLGFDNISPLTTKGDIIVRDAANNVRIAVGDDGQVIIADSAASEGVIWGNTSGGGGLSFDYRFSNSTSPPPPDKRLAYNTAGQIDATQMFVDKDTDSGKDIHNILANLSVGDRLFVVRNNDAGQFQEWRIDVVTDNTAYITYNITLIASDGALFLNNDRIFLLVLGASSGSVTRQNTYDNSSAPQTTTSVSKGAVITRRGSALDTDKVFEVQNGAGNPKFTVHGDGFNEIGRTEYTSFENIPTAGDVAEGDVFIKMPSLSGLWRMELAEGNETMRLGHNVNTGFNTMHLGSLSDSSMIDVFRIVANTILLRGDQVNPGEFDLLKDGTGGPRSFRYMVETTTSAPPGSNSIRYNNATQSSATAIFVHDKALNMGDVALLLQNVSDTATLYISNEGKTKFQEFTLSAVQDQGAYVEFTLAHVQSFGGNMAAEEIVQFVLQEGASGGGGTSFPVLQLDADQMINNTGSDWAVNSIAPVATDTNDASLRVRRFRDSTDDAVAFIIRVPVTATNIIFSFQSRAETAPGGAETVALNFYEREIPDNAAVTTWSAAVQLDDIDIPANEFPQKDSQTLTLAALGLAVGQTHLIQIARDTADGNDTLTDDWSLYFIGVDFA